LESNLAKLSARAAAAKALHQVMAHGRSAAEVIPELLDELAEKERGFAREIFSGSLRYLPRLQWFATQIIQRPIKEKDTIVKAILITGLYQLYYMRVPSHAAVSETVNVTRELGAQWAGKFINGTMRTADSRREALLAEADEADETRFGHPQWLVDWLKHAWPEHWQSILEANNKPASITLRARTVAGGRETLQLALARAGIESKVGVLAAQSLILENGGDVTAMPGFDDGNFVVQDEAAQLAVELLAPQARDRVLDACAAPGGKTCHLLDLQPEIAELIALDADLRRLERVEENLERLGLSAQVVCADATTSGWWDGEQFDRILLDAPCSATGVIRRHPDIKFHRQPSDIDVLAPLQSQILDQMWQMLKPGGTMLYATCSILPKENTAQIKAFLKRSEDASEIPIEADWGLAQVVGRQLLPGQHDSDGFYFARLKKQK
jgi:16S rRNA (cytosine967-C5)-methyltransferase